MMNLHVVEEKITFDLGIKTHLSQSETAVKVDSRAAIVCQAINVLVYKHTHTPTHIHANSTSYEDSPA